MSSHVNIFTFWNDRTPRPRGRPPRCWLHGYFTVTNNRNWQTETMTLGHWKRRFIYLTGSLVCVTILRTPAHCNYEYIFSMCTNKLSFHYWTKNNGKIKAFDKIVVLCTFLFNIIKSEINPRHWYLSFSGSNGILILAPSDWSKLVKLWTMQCNTHI